MRGPIKNKERYNNEEYGKGENIIINFYQEWISPIKGGNYCPMHPSCSQYAKIAFDKYSPFKAFIMTCDRLLRCGHELYLYQTILIDDGIKFYDPISEEKKGEK
jgi:putative component of membrane protein insertase Oxa1/YidC/SpoIIIJ protein YidD